MIFTKYTFIWNEDDVNCSWNEKKLKMEFTQMQINPKNFM